MSKGLEYIKKNPKTKYMFVLDLIIALTIVFIAF
jgi:hypothetical protein